MSFNFKQKKTKCQPPGNSSSNSIVSREGIYNAVKSTKVFFLFIFSHEGIYNAVKSTKLHEENKIKK
jgi:hypothetical protein